MNSKEKANPFSQFTEWFEEAKNFGVREPEAMSLATADVGGKPSARMVLFKGIENESFRFFTNYEGRKGQELIENPFAALVFYWEPLKKQIRIEGSVRKLSAESSDQYWNTRAFESQVGALASKQSQTISSHAELLETYSQLLKKYAGQKIPRPKNWGGFGLHPERIEFWKAGQYRLHERVVFTKTKGQWQKHWLSP